MNTPERGPHDPEQEPEQKKEFIPEQLNYYNEGIEKKDRPEELGKKDREDLEKFVRGAQSDALLRLFEGKSDESLLEVVERHDKEFAPQKMTEIEKDAKEYVEKMPDTLRKIIRDPDVLKQLTESFAGAEEQDIRRELEVMLLGIEKDTEFKQWAEDQYVIRRLRSFTNPEKPQKQEGEFNEEEQKRIQEKISKEAKKLIEAKNFSSIFNEIYDLSKGITSENRIEEILSQIESGKVQRVFENTDKDFRRIYEKLEEKAEKQERMENPYREIERRLLSAQKKLEQEGLHEDAENLTQTINRLRKETVNGKDPENYEILLWNRNSDASPPYEPKGLEKLVEKIDSWMLKIPLLGRYMSRNYRESVRPAGGTIIRANGQKEAFYTFSHFKKPGEKTYTNDLGGGDYHYLTELQPGDEVVAWEPSERGKEIIMEALGGSNVSTPNKFASSLGESDIEYKSGEFSTNNVDFSVRRGENLEDRQFYSTAKLSLFPPPEKGSK